MYTLSQRQEGHNLPQTSLLLGEVIPTRIKKKMDAPQGLRRPLDSANSKLSGGQLILEVCFHTLAPWGRYRSLCTLPLQGYS